MVFLRPFSVSKKLHQNLPGLIVLCSFQLLDVDLFVESIFLLARSSLYLLSSQILECCLPSKDRAAIELISCSGAMNLLQASKSTTRVVVGP